MLTAAAAAATQYRCGVCVVMCCAAHPIPNATLARAITCPSINNIIINNKCNRGGQGIILLFTCFRILPTPPLPVGRAEERGAHERARRQTAVQ